MEMPISPSHSRACLRQLTTMAPFIKYLFLAMLFLLAVSAASGKESADGNPSTATNKDNQAPEAKGKGQGDNGANGDRDNQGQDHNNQGQDHNGANGDRGNQGGNKGGNNGRDHQSGGDNGYNPPPGGAWFPPNTPSGSPTPPTPATPSSPSLSPPPPTTTPTPPTSTPSNPPTTTPTPPTSTPSNPSPSTPTSPKQVSCKSTDYKYRECYKLKHWCPKNCPNDCQVDCVTCKPVCKCDQPGAVCQDPRFIGGDGLTFYFHGKKDRDFCLVSDPNLHINAHFIGKRNEKLTRDFTWVQSIAVLFDNHQLFLGALKTSTWDDSVDRLSLAFDGEPLFLPENEGARWLSASAPGVSVTRVTDGNSVTVEVEGLFKITAKAVPITEEDSRIHNYGIAKDDCFAHLDLRFKFHSLSNQVNGVLGQTYRPGYVSRVNVGSKMSVMGGYREFRTSSIFTPDCAVTQFTGSKSYNDDSAKAFELPILSCASGMDGRGVVCKR